MMTVLQLNILTLNIWGIPYISKDREVRVKAIGDVLATGEYDLVSLQEVWSDADYQHLKSRLAKVLPHTHYFYSGVIGSGLCVFSKFPIEKVFYHSWRLNGYVHRIQHGDWFGGKGVGLAKIRINDQYVNFYTAHLHAEYDRACDDYMTHRVIQAFDTAQFIESTRSHDCVLQILAGDLNTEPNDLAQRIILTTSRMYDTFHLTTNDPEFGTNECEKNSYTDKAALVTCPKGKRIDYIFVRPGQHQKIEVNDYKLPLPKRVPGHDFSYSDHEAVAVTLKLASTTSISDEKRLLENEQQIMEENKVALSECIRHCDESLRELQNNRKNYSMAAIAMIVILLNMIELQAPYGVKTVFLVVKILLTALTMFFIFMGTIWNVIEKHGILSGKLSMELLLKSIEKVNS
ncbi:putative neutral sphingomyelinase [Culicoides brevitarsis]|uniref:putative neutral sphingomyelinase n=1 Tax=Culicoides brevitarsis TaxID=469753 RepID=UPI00307BAD80